MHISICCLSIRHNWNLNFDITGFLIKLFLIFTLNINFGGILTFNISSLNPDLRYILGRLVVTRLEVPWDIDALLVL